MKYVIGIDSGGTNFRVEACDLTGKQLAFYIGVPANHYYVDEEELSRRVNANIDACLALFGGKREDAAYLICGTTGLDSPEDEALLNRFYGSLPGFHCPVKVINDAELAHYTVTGGFGVLVISGTGSIAFGRNKAGQTCRSGGWLFTIQGDEGSGTWISRMALRYVGRWLDGAVPESPLVTMVCEHLHIKDRNDLNTIAARSGTPPWYTPPLADIVNKAADAGDAAAADILQQAADLVAQLVEDTAAALDMPRTEPNFIIGVWGSAILKSPRMLKTFRARLARTCPQAEIRLPQRSATEGAVAMALDLLQGA